QADDEETRRKSMSGLTCELIPTLMDQYLASHTIFGEQDNTLVDRVVEAWSERLDSNEVLLIAEEYKAVLAKMTSLTLSVREEQCQDFDCLREEQIAWHTEMEVFARELLSDDTLEIDATIELQLDADKRERPKTKDEQAELRRKILHLQLANYVNAGIPLDEAREKVTKRYERTRKRIESIETVELYGEFLDAFARALDPHSSYLSADDLEDFRISMELSLEGIGAL